MQILVDSSVWIDHLRGIKTRETEFLQGLLTRLDPLPESAGRTEPPADILLGDLILCEILRGIDDDGQHARVRRVLLAFEQVTLTDMSLALEAADHYRALRRLGITVRKTIDCLIATWCIHNAVPLLHADRGFRPFMRHRGLRVV